MRTNPGAPLSPELTQKLKQQRDEIDRRLSRVDEQPDGVASRVTALKHERNERSLVVEALRDRDPALADKIDGCGSLIICTETDRGHVAPRRVNYCRKPLVCDGCASRWQRDRYDAQRRKIESLLTRHPNLHASWVMLTRWTRVRLPEAVETLTRSLRQFLEVGARRNRGKSRDRIASLCGAYWRVEIERSAENRKWHPHVHALIFTSEALRQADVERLWKSISSGRKVGVVPLGAPGVDNVGPRLQTIGQKLWYMLKPNKMAPEDRGEAYVKLTNNGDRPLPALTGAKGALYGKADLGAEPSRDTPERGDVHVVRRGEEYYRVLPAEANQ